MPILVRQVMYVTAQFKHSMDSVLTTASSIEASSQRCSNCERQNCRGSISISVKVNLEL
jgi:hypothetical protein